MSFIYFCYGSNMLTKRMHINCPSAKHKCIAKLKNFKLAFKSYGNAWKGAPATIIESVSDVVWGVVWEISKDEEAKLDRQEVGYKKIEVKVEKPDGSELLCKTYQLLHTTEEHGLPSGTYKTVIIRGAEEFKLPPSYINQLKLLKDNGYNGDVPNFKLSNGLS